MSIFPLSGTCYFFYSLLYLSGTVTGPWYILSTYFFELGEDWQQGNCFKKQLDYCGEKENFADV